MIIGHGSLAKLLQDREGAVLFASGVSNSRLDWGKDGYCKEAGDACDREMALIDDYYYRSIDLRTILSKKTFFYFSTIITKPLLERTNYMIHKQNMERRIRERFKNYIIIRIGNIWECTNPNTFLNYIKSHPEAEIRDNEIKYMIHADELNMICQALPLTGKHEISVFSEMLTVRQCLERKNPR